MQAYRFKTKLTEVAGLVSGGYEDYLRRRLEEREGAKEELSRLSELALYMPATPMKGGRYIVAVKRGDKWYLRRSPTKPPTPPKAKTWNEFARLTKLAKRLSYEEVAELVGGKVVDVGEHLGKPELRGKKAILLDGQLLTKAQAVLKLMKGKRFAVPESGEEKLLKLVRWALGLED